MTPERQKIFKNIEVRQITKAESEQWLYEHKRKQHPISWAEELYDKGGYQGQFLVSKQFREKAERYFKQGFFPVWRLSWSLSAELQAIQRKLDDRYEVFLREEYLFWPYEIENHKQYIGLIETELDHLRVMNMVIK